MSIERRIRELEASMERRDAITQEVFRRLAERSWQPIESAPKDGTRVLLATPEGIWIGHWTTCRGESWWSPWPSVPTHWMPLPKAPE